MIALTQYPHYLYAETIGLATQDENGNWLQEQSSWQLVGRCRYEVNSGGSTFKGEDGTARVFSGIVYMPLSTERLVEGANIVVATEELDGGVLSDKNAVLSRRLNGTVLISAANLYFSKGLMNCRMWT